MQVAWAWASRSRAVSIEVSEARPIRDFVRLTGTGGEAATSRARDSASLPTVTAGTTRFASPRRSASPASTVRPVHPSSLARAAPTRCDSRWIPPRSGIRPKRTSSMAKRTSSAHTRRSQARASWNPAPTAWPWTSATAGLSMWARTRNGRWAVRMNVRNRAPRVPASWPSRVTSMPAENEGPSPRTSTARMPGSEAAASAASPSSLNIRALMALRLSGRASSIVATPSWIPYRIVSKSAIAGHATIGPRALSSAGERRPYKAEVGGSKPPAPTEKAAGQSQLSVPVHHRDAGGIPHRLRGKTAGATFLPVRPHGSRIESADSRPGRYADWVAAMFVDRDGELAALEEFTARALRERVPVAAVLFGDPGMAWASGAREHRSRRDSASRSNLKERERRRESTWGRLPYAAHAYLSEITVGARSGELAAEGASHRCRDHAHVLCGLVGLVPDDVSAPVVDEALTDRDNMWRAGRIVVLVVRECSLRDRDEHGTRVAVPPGVGSRKVVVPSHDDVDPDFIPREVEHEHGSRPDAIARIVRQHVREPEHLDAPVVDE